MIGADTLPPWQLLIIVPSIAFLYSGVGFGGASGYLAAMCLFAIIPAVMSSTALTLNVLVSSIAFLAYYHTGHFSPRLLWPFLASSVPSAFLGGFVAIPGETYLILLFLALSYLGVRMLLVQPLQDSAEEPRSFPWAAAVAAGAIIGLLSGIIGIGGGIFLSPLIVLAGWGTPKQAAASAAGFIFVNSLSGLLGRWVGGSLEIGIMGVTVLPLGVLAAVSGSRLGAHHLSHAGIRRLLAIVLLIAAARFWLGLLG